MGPASGWRDTTHERPSVSLPRRQILMRPAARASAWTTRGSYARRRSVEPVAQWKTRAQPANASGAEVVVRVVVALSVR